MARQTGTAPARIATYRHRPFSQQQRDFEQSHVAENAPNNDQFAHDGLLFAGFSFACRAIAPIFSHMEVCHLKKEDLQSGDKLAENE